MEWAKWMGPKIIPIKDQILSLKKCYGGIDLFSRHIRLVGEIIKSLLITVNCSLLLRSRGVVWVHVKIRN